MKPGDIVFIRGNTRISRIIQYFDKGEFSHVAICVAPGKIIEAEWSTRVRIVDFDYDDYELVPMGLTAEEILEVENLAKTFEGMRYDFFQVLLLWLHLVFGLPLGLVNDPKKVVCSELVAYFLVHLDKAPPEIIHTTPNMMYNILVNIAE